MSLYIIICGRDIELRRHLAGLLANEGWLVAAADEIGDLHQHIQRHGPPGLLIQLPTFNEENEELWPDQLPPGYGQSLAIVFVNDDTPIHDDAWSEFNDLIVLASSSMDKKADMELVMRVRRLLQGNYAHMAHLFGAPAMHETMNADGQVMGMRSTWVEDPWSEHLSATERRIIAKLQAAKGEAVSMGDLAQCVAGASPEARINSLRVHITRLRKKIEADPAQPRYVVTVRGIGYRLNLTQHGFARDTRG